MAPKIKEQLFEVPGGGSEPVVQRVGPLEHMVAEDEEREAKAAARRSARVVGEDQRRELAELREDIADQLKAIDVNVSHFDLRWEGKPKRIWWRMQSLCEHAKWKTAKGDDTRELARKLSRAARCCPKGRLPKPPRELSGGLRRVSRGTRERIIARDGLVCWICGLPVAEKDVHIDHVEAVARGGDSHDMNLRVAHKACNLRKGTRRWEELDTRPGK
jgi:hypothetical protein